MVDAEELESSQESLLTIISSLIVEDDKEEISRMQQQALEIISNKDYREHINDGTPYRCTILDAVKKCSVSVGQSYIEKHGLAEMEQAIKDAGGKALEELGRNSSLDEINHEDLINDNRSTKRPSEYDKKNICSGRSMCIYMWNACCVQFETSRKRIIHMDRVIINMWCYIHCLCNISLLYNSIALPIIV